jgi:hypothetical protein
MSTGPQATDPARLIGTAPRFYRGASWTLAAAFALTGGLFLFFPALVAGFFNGLGSAMNLPPAPPDDAGVFHALSTAYMAVVTLLAWRMVRYDGDRFAPSLLLQAKAASALLSFGLFLFRQPHAILLANGIVDGALALLVLLLIRLRFGTVR